MENNIENKLVKVVELNKDEKLLENITNLLKEHNIKFKIDLEENWTIPYKYAKYIPKFSVYVEKDFEEETIQLIENITESYVPNEEELLKEEPNDQTEKQALNVKNSKKIFIISFLSILCILFIGILVYNILH